MPNRILREGILTSETVSELGWAEEVFYRRLMSVADDHGRYHALPKLLRAACYPLQIDKVSDADIGKWTTKCVAAGLVSVYLAEDGKRYLQIVKFGQQVRSKSKFPEPANDFAGDHPAPDEITCEQVIADAHLDGDGDGDGDGKKNAPKVALDFGECSDQVITDFLKLRKAKKAELTQTALTGIKREAKKAGMSLQDALETCCLRGWAGFKAEWVASNGAGNGSAQQPQLEELRA